MDVNPDRHLLYTDISQPGLGKLYGLTNIWGWSSSPQATSVPSDYEHNAQSARAFLLCPAATQLDFVAHAVVGLEDNNITSLRHDGAMRFPLPFSHD
jgi:hypothetical protein